MTDSTHRLGQNTEDVRPAQNGMEGHMGENEEHRKAVENYGGVM